MTDVMMGERRRRRCTSIIRAFRPEARCALAVALGAMASSVFAAHPFVTEDPGTQGWGHVELEFGYAAEQGDPSSGGNGNVFSPQFSYGILETADIIVQGRWLSQRPAGEPAERGIGDTLLDVKWRFYERDEFALAVRAGLDLPTGNDTKGLGAGRTGFHVIAIAGQDFTAASVYANVAYARVNQPGARANQGAVSLAVTSPEDAPLRTFIEATAFSNGDPARSQWPAFARTGVIYTINQWLDVDVGYQARLNRSATRQAFLAGATIRW